MQLFAVSRGLRCKSNARPGQAKRADKSERGNYGEPTQSREGLLRSPREREFSKYFFAEVALNRLDHRRIVRDRTHSDSSIRSYSTVNTERVEHRGNFWSETHDERSESWEIRKVIYFLGRNFRSNFEICSSLR